jgi:uncharacterized protein (DUF58 family)
VIWSAIRRRLREWRRAADFVPTRRLATLAAISSFVWLASGTAVGRVAAAAVVLVLLAGVATDVVLLPSAGDLELTREVPEAVGVGDVAAGRYEIRSHWNRPLVVSLYDAIPAPFLETHREPTRLALAADGMVELSFEVEGRARGSAVLGDVALRVGTSLGLVDRTLHYPMTDSALVAPSLAGVRRFRWLAVHHRLAVAGVRDARRRGEGRSFARLRDYVIGDDPRHIDWKATARRGHPITREFTTEQSQTVYVVVDAGRTMTQLAGKFPRFEYALSSALVLADVATNAGDRVGAMVFDDQLRAFVPAQRGAAALHALRSALVPLQPSLVEPDYAAAFRAFALRQRKRSLLVLLTDVIDARAARSLLAHLTRGMSRHLAIVVALRNEALVAAAAAPVATDEALYAKGAAEELLADRAAALQRMREAGVIVLDVAPDQMAAAVVSEYLELKARGAL